MVFDEEDGTSDFEESDSLPDYLDEGDLAPVD